MYKKDLKGFWGLYFKQNLLSHASWFACMRIFMIKIRKKTIIWLLRQSCTGSQKDINGDKDNLNSKGPCPFQHISSHPSCLSDYFYLYQKKAQLWTMSSLLLLHRPMVTLVHSSCLSGEQEAQSQNQTARLQINMPMCTQENISRQ